jgi:ATP-dependent protease HslVU (ClpYQ) peptidase subunit
MRPVSSVFSQTSNFTPKVVADRILQDALHQQRELARGPVAIALGEAEHRVLHDVERGILVPDREQGLLVCTALDAFQKRRKLAARCQGGLFVASRGGSCLALDVTKSASETPGVRLDRSATTH